MRPSDDQSLLRKLAEACGRLAAATELPERAPSDQNHASLTWTFFDELPEEALLGRLLIALGAWDPEDSQQYSVSPEAELELVELAARTQALIERSSLGEPAVKLLRERADPERIAKIRRMLKEWRTTGSAHDQDRS